MSEKGEVVFRDWGYFGPEPRVLMQPCNEESGGIRLISGSEIYGFLKNDLLA
jgi:hypothetical protein